MLEALKQVFYEQSQQDMELAPPVDATRKTSAASTVSGKIFLKICVKYFMIDKLNPKVMLFAVKEVQRSLEGFQPTGRWVYLYHLSRFSSYREKNVRQDVVRFFS